jgi:Mg/Co/Ni transporter MgtE
MSASQRVGTVLISAGFVCAAVPALFFTIVVPLEHAVFLREARAYVDSWCWCRLLVSLLSAPSRISGAAWLATTARGVALRLADADAESHESNRDIFRRALLLIGGCSATLVVAGLAVWLGSGRAWSLVAALADALLVAVTFSVIECATVWFLMTRYRTDPYASNIVMIDAILQATAAATAGAATAGAATAGAATVGAATAGAATVGAATAGAATAGAATAGAATAGAATAGAH